MSSNSPKNKKPRLVGLTGGIGAGKSLVAKIFKILGTPVFDADQEAREILITNEHVRTEIIAAFGEKAYADDIPNRPYLASKVFSDPSLRVKLNAIVHPKVARAFDVWTDQHSFFPYVIKEAAITFETGIYKDMDLMITVTAPVDVRIERTIKRDQSTEAAVRGRMESQWSDEEKIKLSDYVIVNDGSQPIIPQTLQIHNSILTGQTI